MSLTPTLILARRAGSEKSRTEPEFGMQVKNPQTRATKVNSEHHKVSESSSANAQRMRATNLPCHRPQRESAKPKFSGSQVVNLSPIEYSWHRKHASINETVISVFETLTKIAPPGENKGVEAERYTKVHFSELMLLRAANQRGFQDAHSVPGRGYQFPLQVLFTIPAVD